MLCLSDYRGITYYVGCRGCPCRCDSVPCGDYLGVLLFFFSSIRRHTRYWHDWSSDVCSSDLLARPDGAGGWELSVVRRGRLVSAGVTPRGASVRATLAGLLSTAETPLGPDGEIAASVDETELVLRWMEKPGTRLRQLDGTLASPAPGTGPFSRFLAMATHSGRDPFADGRSLGTRARPDRITAGVGGGRRSRIASPT